MTENNTMKKEAKLAFTIEPNGDYFLAFDGDGRQVAKIYDEEFAEKLAAVVNSHGALLEAAKRAKAYIGESSAYKSGSEYGATVTVELLHKAIAQAKGGMNG